MEAFTSGRVVAPTPHEVPEEVDELLSPHAVHCRRSVVERFDAHAKMFNSREVFGLLLGRAVRTPSGKLRTILEELMLAEALTVSTVAAVEVSAAELSRLDDVFDEKHKNAGLLRMGWVHSHPGHGVFMSGTDRENHALYRLPWQVALVVDPIRSEFGFFAGPDCRPVAYLLTDDGGRPDTGGMPNGAKPTRQPDPAPDTHRHPSIAVNKSLDAGSVQCRGLAVSSFRKALGFTLLLALLAEAAWTVSIQWQVTHHDQQLKALRLTLERLNSHAETGTATADVP